MNVTNIKENYAKTHDNKICFVIVVYIESQAALALSKTLKDIKNVS